MQDTLSHLFLEITQMLILVRMRVGDKEVVWEIKFFLISKLRTSTYLLALNRLPLPSTFFQYDVAQAWEGEMRGECQHILFRGYI